MNFFTKRSSKTILIRTSKSSNTKYEKMIKSHRIKWIKKVELKKIVHEKIVENLKLKFQIIYLKRLKSLQIDNWNWNRFKNFNSENMIVVEFNNDNWCEIIAKCNHCSLKLFCNNCKKLLIKHFQKSFQCSFVLQFEKQISKIIKRIELKILKISKFIFVVANIDYFDAILLCDIQEFDLHHETTSFCQHLQNIQINYREKKLFALLFEYFRDFALIWYKQQRKKKREIDKKNLNEWLKILINAFSSKFSAKFSIQIFVSFVFSSSQYYSCLNCFAFFSSLTRLLQYIQTICRKIVCKHCEKIFESKNKFHEHIRQHHVMTAKKINKFVSKRNFNKKKNKISTTISSISSTILTTILSKTISKFSISKSITFSERSRNSFILFVIFATIASTTSKRSHFSLFTFEFISKRVKIASTICSSISFATFSSKFQKFHFTIDDLIRIFREKFKFFDLSQHQERRFFSQNFDVCQSYQSRIIVYFLFAINQKTSINQNLKNSNSKSF